MRHKLRHCWQGATYQVLALVALLLLACQLPMRPPAPPPPATQTPRPNIATATPTAAPADTGWEPLQTGLERRTLRLFDTQGRTLELLYILRLNPAHFHFDIGYSPGAPKSLADWQSETGALIVANGGYFTEEFVATGRIIANGQPSGVSYGDFAGMVALQAEAIEVRWLGERPYNAAEPLRAALQSFPMLIKPGGQLGFPASAEDGRRARRTVIGQDTDGRILLLIAPQGHFTLHELSRYLAESDLALDVALNLDGGPSSGLLLAAPEDGFPAYSALPTVLTVHPR